MGSLCFPTILLLKAVFKPSAQIGQNSVDQLAVHCQHSEPYSVTSRHASSILRWSIVQLDTCRFGTEPTGRRVILPEMEYVGYAPTLPFSELNLI